MDVLTSATLTGVDAMDAPRLKTDPKRLRDVLLLRAKRAAKKAKANHLSDAEQRGVSWFAHLPEYNGKENHIMEYIEVASYYTAGFWAAWRRDPNAVLRLTKTIREHFPLSKPDMGRENHEAVKWPREPKNDPTDKKNNARRAYERERQRVKRNRTLLRPTGQIEKFTTKIAPQ
jgi:hypothetical protein